MSRDWPADALAFEESVSAALRSLGGVELTRACEADPARRESELQPALDSLGFADIDLRAGETEAAAAALGANAAGRVIAPWPLVAELAAPRGTGFQAIYPVDGTPRRAEHLDVMGSAVAIDVRDGTCHVLEPLGSVARMPLDPFGVSCRLGTEVECPAPAAALAGHCVLSAFYVLGALETAVDLAASYSAERHQFDRPISSFGAIQWRLADLSGARSALSELAAFTFARLVDEAVTAADLWGLRLTMIEAAQSVLASSHQILGAIGLCEEHDVAVIDRHLQGVLRRPLGLSATNTALAERVAAEGFDLLYPVEPRATATDSRATAA